MKLRVFDASGETFEKIEFKELARVRSFEDNLIETMRLAPAGGYSATRIAQMKVSIWSTFLAFTSLLLFIY